MTFKPVPVSSDGPAIWVNEVDGIIRLTGTFEDNKQTGDTVEEALKYAAQIWPKETWHIDAQNAHMSPKSMTSWGHAVQRHLRECYLMYRDSEMARSLVLDSGYPHRHSKFFER